MVVELLSGPLLVPPLLLLVCTSLSLLIQDVPIPLLDALLWLIEPNRSVHGL